MPSTLPAPQYVQLLGSPQTSSVRVFYGGLVVLGVKNLPASAGDIRDVGSIPELGRSPGGENGNPVCLGDPMNRGAWHASRQSCKESDTTKAT